MVDYITPFFVIFSPLFFPHQKTKTQTHSIKALIIWF